MQDTYMYLFTFLVNTDDCFKFSNGVSAGYASIEYANKKLTVGSIHYLRKINVWILN